MSAFIVDKIHIDGLVQAMLESNGFHSPFRYFFKDKSHAVVKENANDIGSMLWEENLKSIDSRYPDCKEDGKYPGPIDFSTKDIVSYTYKRASQRVKLIDALKAIDCYEYQTCEHNDWEKSESFAICQSLRKWLISRLPGYEEASWG